MDWYLTTRGKKFEDSPGPQPTTYLASAVLGHWLGVLGDHLSLPAKNKTGGSQILDNCKRLDKKEVGEVKAF